MAIAQNCDGGNEPYPQLHQNEKMAADMGELSYRKLLKRKYFVTLKVNKSV